MVTDLWGNFRESEGGRDGAVISVVLRFAVMRCITRSLSPVLAVVLSVAGVTSGARADEDPNALFKPPVPAGGDEFPFLPPYSATDADAPTVGVVGDSVARQLSFFFARHLGPRGIRVVDVAVPACPAGELPMQDAWGRPRRYGECPRLVRSKLSRLAGYHPKVIIWHSGIERYYAAEHGKVHLPGTKRWKQLVSDMWDDTLRQVTAHGERVILILPPWYENRKPGALSSLRDFYVKWAGRHKGEVKVVNVDRVVCRFKKRQCVSPLDKPGRPDTGHYTLRMGGILVAHISKEPEIARLSGGRPE